MDKLIAKANEKYVEQVKYLGNILISDLIKILNFSCSQEKIQQTLIKLLDGKVKQFAKLKATIESKKIQRSNADLAKQMKLYRIETFEKFFEELMEKKDEEFKLELTKTRFNEEEVEKFFL